MQTIAEDTAKMGWTGYQITCLNNRCPHEVRVSPQELPQNRDMFRMAGFMVCKKCGSSGADIVGLK